MKTTMMVAIYVSATTWMLPLANIFAEQPPASQAQLQATYPSLAEQAGPSTGGGDGEDPSDDVSQDGPPPVPPKKDPPEPVYPPITPPNVQT